MQNTVDSANVATPYNAHYGAEYILKRVAWSAAGMGAIAMHGDGKWECGVMEYAKKQTKTHAHTLTETET